MTTTVKSQNIHFTIHRCPEVSSTNTLVKEMARNGAKEGWVMVADYQTEGRGKPGRSWVSPRGKDLLVSVLLKPPIPSHRAPMLTQVFCRSVAATLKKKYGVLATFKRPNDVLVNHKKICGILAEVSSSGFKTLDHVVVGIGLNVNSKESELVPGATSLLEIMKKSVDREALLKALLRQIREDLKEIYAYSA